MLRCPCARRWSKPTEPEGEPVKVRASVKPICEKCRVIKRHGRIIVICQNKRHKQAQG